MSMLSAQVDKLRELATRYDELQAGMVKAVTMPSDMGSILREAADTIWELRLVCVDLVDERERLFQANVERNGDVLRLADENAKLRKLLASTISNYADGYMDGTSARYPCDLCDESSMQQCDYPHDEQCPFYRQLRELGVEVG